MILTLSANVLTYLLTVSFAGTCSLPP